MAKTFLELTNEVGKNARLSTGTTWTAIDTTADQILIQQFLNMAKRMVEGERQWEVLQETVTFDSVVGTFTYDTSDLTVVTSDPVVSNERSELVETDSGIDLFYDVTDTASGDRLRRVKRDQVINRRRIDNGGTTDEQPNVFACYQSGDGLTIEFPYAPSAVRNYSLEVYNPQADLAIATTELTAPWRPIVLAASALFADERGEELGLDASTWWAEYKSALSSAIVADMQSDPVLEPV